MQTEGPKRTALNPNGGAAARPLLGIVTGGVIAGGCDISYAVGMGLRAGRPASRTLKSVASGLLGRPAFDSGADIAALGLLLHFVIALGWAMVFFVASRKLAFLRSSNPVLVGPLFGALVYVMMNRVIVPLSAAPFTLPMQFSGLAVHMFLVGLPIAVMVSRFAPSK